ncbi:MAG TPA: hypothetical protein VF135_13720 [Terriglobales bacterium]
MRRWLATLVLLTATLPLHGEDLHRLLLPIAVTNIPGAFGSVWSSIGAVNNAGSAEHVLYFPEMCQIPECPPPSVVKQTGQEINFVPQPGGSPGLIAYTEGTRDDLNFNLRVQDLSRQAQTWGTQIPVVWEEDLFATSKRLLNVPVGSDFRTTLRIYDIENRADARFRVRIFHLMSNKNTLGETELVLHAPSPVPPTSRQFKPSFAQVPDVAMLITTPTPEPMVGVEITPLYEGPHFFTFASVANNATQHVTTIVPE